MLENSLNDRRLTVLCFGDSNTWGAIPGPLNPMTNLPHRYKKDHRWSHVMQSELGDRFEVIEAGLNSRTIALTSSESSKPFISGIQFLPFILETHTPLDVVIIYLGTNDTKTKFNCSVEEITENMRQLVRLVKQSNKGFNGKAPHILLLAPPSILKNTEFYPQFDKNSIVKSKQLAPAYKKIAQEERCVFFDLGEIISSSEIDGLHLNANQHLIIGKSVAKLIIKFF